MCTKTWVVKRNATVELKGPNRNRGLDIARPAHLHLLHPHEIVALNLHHDGVELGAVEH